MNIPVCALALLLGVLLLDIMPTLPSAWWLMTLMPLALFWRWRVFRYLTIAMLGFAWAWWSAYGALQHRLPVALERVDFDVTGVVQPFPKGSNPVTHMTLRVTQFDSPASLENPPRKIRLSWYWPDATPHAGEKWRFRVRLKRPNGYQNPGGFDYEGWLFRNGIDATGYVRHDRARRLAPASEASLMLRLRQRLGDVVDAAVPASPYTGVLKGVTIGDGHDIPDAQWTLFRRTGIMHLVVISGSHIVLVAGFVGLLVAFFWRMSARLCESLAARRAAVLGGLAAATIYSLIAGFGIPVQRALIMFAVGAFAVWRGQEARPFSVLAVALAGVVLYDPLAPLSAGFWLSFGAVAILLYVFSGRPRRGLVYNTLSAQLAVSIGLLPFMAAFFAQASLIGPLANLLAIPVFSIVVVPMALAGVLVGMFWLPAGALLLKGAALALAWLWPALGWFAQLPQSQFSLNTSSFLAIGLAITGVILLLSPRGVPGRWLGAVLLAPVLFSSRSPPPAGAFDLTLLDVGQGLSAVVKTHSHTLIFDTGPDFTSGSDTGELIVVPYLRSRNIASPDSLIISHGDRDHAGGAEALMAAYPDLRMITSATDKFPRAAGCVAGQTWRWDGVTFRMLNPARGMDAASGNNRSCVLKVTAPGGSILLTGDIEATTEARLVKRYGSTLDSDVMVAPHHGSATSSSDVFVAAADPDWVLFPVGYLNQWHFPRGEVKARYERVGAQMLNTAACGAIHFRVAQTVKLVTVWRADHRRLWTRAGETSCGPA